MCLTSVFTVVCEVTRHVIHTYRPTPIAAIYAPAHSFWGSRLRHKLITSVAYNIITTDTVLFALTACFGSEWIISMYDTLCAGLMPAQFVS
jgi:hypothetical protein